MKLNKPKAAEAIVRLVHKPGECGCCDQARKIKARQMRRFREGRVVRREKAKTDG